MRETLTWLCRVSGCPKCRSDDDGKKLKRHSLCSPLTGPTGSCMMSAGKAFELNEGCLGQIARKLSAAKRVRRLSKLSRDVMLVPEAV